MDTNPTLSSRILSTTNSPKKGWVKRIEKIRDTLSDEKKIHIWLFIISLLAAVHCTTAQEIVEEEIVDTLKKRKRNHIQFDLVWIYQNRLWPNLIKAILGWSW